MGEKRITIRILYGRNNHSMVITIAFRNILFIDFQGTHSVFFFSSIHKNGMVIFQIGIDEAGASIINV